MLLEHALTWENAMGKPLRVITDRVGENHETIGGSLPGGCAVLVGELDCDRLVRHADPRPMRERRSHRR